MVSSVGLHLAEISSLPVEVLEEARDIASSMKKERTVQDSITEDTPSKAKIHKLGGQLVQVARNSLLDISSLRYII